MCIQTGSQTNGHSSIDSLSKNIYTVCGLACISTTLPLLRIQNIYNTYFKELKIFPCVQTSGPNQYTLYKLSLLSKINLQLCSIKI